MTARLLTGDAMLPGVNPKARRSPPVSGWADGPGSHAAIDHQREGAHPKTNGRAKRSKQNPSFASAVKDVGATRNTRSVWTMGSEPYSGAHFACFPSELARRCILAGSAPGDTVLDPFSGSGTTAAVAVGHGRNAIGIELNPKYQDLARHRIGPMLCTVEGSAP